MGQAFLALGALAIGGIGIAKIYGNFGGAFMILPILLLFISWLKIIKKDGANLLAFHTKTPKQATHSLYEEENHVKTSNS